MTPVAGTVADTQKYRLVLFCSAFKRLRAPGIPIHRIVRMLQKVGTCRVLQTVAHFITSSVLFAISMRRARAAIRTNAGTAAENPGYAMFSSFGWTGLRVFFGKQRGTAARRPSPKIRIPPPFCPRRFVRTTGRRLTTGSSSGCQSAGAPCAHRRRPHA